MQGNGVVLYGRHVNGELLPLSTEDGALTVRTYTQAIAEGDIPNHTAWTKIGFNGALGSSQEDIWTVGGVYVFPNTPMQMEVVSSSASDAAEGTGIRTMRIFYLTTDFTEATEDITLNGTTPVATVATNIYRINHARTLTCGSNGAAVGDIDIRHLSDTPIYGRIAAGYNRLRQFIYTVPKGKKLFIFNVFVSAGSNVAGRQVRFETKGNFDTFLHQITPFFQVYSEFIVQDAAVDVPIEIPTSFMEGTDLKISATSPDGATAGNCIVRGWLELT